LSQAQPSVASQYSAGVRSSGRLEYKFRIARTLHAELRAALAPFVHADPFAASKPDRQYTVRSIYYDNRRFRCYDEKFDGFRLKKKFRIRGYDEEGPDNLVFLEVKRKQEDFISKSRAPVRWDEVAAVLSGYGARIRPLPFGPGTLEAEAAGRFLYNYYRLRLVPAVLIAYEREPFFGRFDSSLRITIDKNVRSRLYPPLGSLYSDRGMMFALPDEFVFEVKFYGSLPRWLRSLLTWFDLERLAVSKFALGIDCQRVERKFQRGAGQTVELPGSRPILNKEN